MLQNIEAPATLGAGPWTGKSSVKNVVFVSLSAKCIPLYCYSISPATASLTLIMWALLLLPKCKGKQENFFKKDTELSSSFDWVNQPWAGRAVRLKDIVDNLQCSDTVLQWELLEVSFFSCFLKNSYCMKFSSLIVPTNVQWWPYFKFVIRQMQFSA